jgi:hypothetical protein
MSVLVYADDVNLLGCGKEAMTTTQNKAEILLWVSKEAD